MPNKFLHILDIVIRVVITVFFVLFPILFLPIFTEFYDTAKFIFLIVCALLLLALYGIRIVVSRTIIIPKSQHSIGFFALSIVSLIGLFVASANKIEAFVQPFGAASFFGFTIIISIALIYRGVFIKQWVRWGLLASATIIGIVIIYLALGMGKLLVGPLPYLADPYWTPVGNPYSAGVVLLIAFVLSVWNIRESLKEKHDGAVILSVIMTVLIGAGFGVIVYRFAPQYFKTILPMGFAWNILLEVYKNPKIGFFGVGIENYGNAFTVAKSILINQTPLWNVRFLLSSSAFLHIATTLGVFGILGMIFFLKILIFPLSFTKYPEWSMSAIIAIFVLLFMPPNFVVFGIIGALCILKPSDSDELRVTEVPPLFKWVGIAIAVICLLLSGTGLYFVGRYAYADMIFAESLRFAKANDGKNTYEKQVRAIQLNPNISGYHLAFAQVNIALASSIVNTAKQNATDKTGQTQLSENDQKTIAQLVQQGIQQAKTAISLAPNNSTAWEVLGRIYGNITGMVQDADTWAITAYEKQIQLDPTTPQARFNLAGAYMVKKDFSKAREQLLIAAQLRPDIANIHYNLAYVFRNLKDYVNEKQALVTTLKYVEKGSEDYKKVENEISAVDLLIAPVEQPQQPQQVVETNEQQPLVTPPAEPKTQVTPKIEITP